MVQSLNWNNFSNSQIVEMKNSGIEVPQDIYEKAQTAMSQEVNGVSNDQQKVSYSVNDYSGEANEAKEMVDELKADGTKLKNIVRALTEKCDSFTEELSGLLEEVNNNISYVSVNTTTLNELSQNINAQQAEIESATKETEEKIAEKQNEFDSIYTKINDGTATEEDQQKAETLGQEITDISKDGNAKIASKESLVQQTNTKIVNINSDIANVAQTVGKAINKVNDGMEFVNETREQVHKLRNKNKGFMGFGGSKAEKRIANHGATAADKLENNVRKVDRAAHKVARQNNITITKQSSTEQANEKLNNAISNSKNTINGLADSNVNNDDKLKNKKKDEK
ncbi:hypothetical protein IJG72_03920 [bacterium]|nr:hypothetical protein [bacterium]